MAGGRRKATRARGLADWNPHEHVLVVIEQVDAILAEYEDHLPLTIRQIFYRLVGNHGFEKTEAAYSRLAEYLNRARRSGRIPFESIRDDGITCVKPSEFSDVPHFWRAVMHTASNLRFHRLDGQERSVEVWVEAAGMVPQIARVADPYGIAVYSSGGFNSTTLKHETARRLEDTDAVVLHIGDLDPSGVAMFDSLEDDIQTFLRDMLTAGSVDFERIVLTPEQVEEYDLPTSPPKPTDRRSNYQGLTAQAEALPPSTLATVVRDAILRHVDEDIWEEAVEREQPARERLVAQIEQHIADSEDDE
jgi:hypothetical protein